MSWHLIPSSACLKRLKTKQDRRANNAMIGNGARKGAQWSLEVRPRGVVWDWFFLRCVLWCLHHCSPSIQTSKRERALKIGHVRLYVRLIRDMLKQLHSIKLNTLNTPPEHAQSTIPVPVALTCLNRMTWGIMGVAAYRYWPNNGRSTSSPDGSLRHWHI